MPRYIKIGDPWRLDLLEYGSVVQRYCRPWGYVGQVNSPTPCCGRKKRFSVTIMSYLQNQPDHSKGVVTRCPGCSRTWWVRLIDKHSHELLPDKPHSTDVIAEWELKHVPSRS